LEPTAIRFVSIFAERILAEFRELYPFGGKIMAEGEHISVGARVSSERSARR
jgi:hypothetical protein